MMTLINVCTCIPCGECGGDGFAWLSFYGEYLGKHRCDDMDQLEMCPECHGACVLEVCDACRMAEEVEG